MSDDLTDRDIADLESMNELENPPALRAIVREIHAYSHPDEPELELGRETWVQGSVEIPKELGVEGLVRLDSGNGLGNARLSLVVEIDGVRIGWEYIDVTTLVESWARTILDDYASGNTAEADRIADARERLLGSSDSVTPDTIDE